jgi:hypothetical protein
VRVFHRKRYKWGSCYGLTYISYCAELLQLLNERISTKSIHFAQQDQRVQYVDKWEQSQRKYHWPAKSPGWQCKSLCQEHRVWLRNYRNRYKNTVPSSTSLPLLHTSYLDDLFATSQSPSQAIREYSSTHSVTYSSLPARGSPAGVHQTTRASSAAPPSRRFLSNQREAVSF